MGVPDQVKNRFAANFFRNVNLFKDLENHRANVKAMSKKDREKLIPSVEVITVENSDEYKKNFKKNTLQLYNKLKNGFNKEFGELLGLDSNFYMLRNAYRDLVTIQNTFKSEMDRLNGKMSELTRLVTQLSDSSNFSKDSSNFEKHSKESANKSTESNNEDTDRVIQALRSGFKNLGR